MYGLRFRETVWPIAAGALPNSRIEKAWLMTAVARGVGPGIGLVEETALKWPRAEHAKEVHGHAFRVEPLREIAARDEHPVGQ